MDGRPLVSHTFDVQVAKRPGLTVDPDKVSYARMRFHILKIYSNKSLLFCQGQL